MDLLDVFRQKILDKESDLFRIPENHIARRRTIRRELAVWNEALELLKTQLEEENIIRYGPRGPKV